jgi:heterodisulfide reductase subunit A
MTDVAKQAETKAEAKSETREEPRIGVFICHCGTNIGGIVDVPAVAAYAGTLPHVVHSERNLYTCAEDGVASIKAKIKEHALNRVIVASCTPRTHAPLFMATCAEAGLNPYLFEFVNIRDQCSWIHMSEKEKATQKAKDLVRMGVAKAALLQPLERIETPMEPKAMVIGGGVAGMTAASTIANSGYEVYLVEKEDALGGMLLHLNRLYHSNRDPSVVSELARSVESNKRIHVIKGAKVKRVDGYVGSFEVYAAPIKGGDDIHFRVGTIIVATGAVELKPKGLYGYGTIPSVVTELDLEGMMKRKEMPDVGSAVLILCAGSRGQQDLTYCSRVCCMTGLKNAIAIKEMFPKSQVTVLYRDIETYGIAYEDLNAKARKLGIRFVKYSLARIPKVEPAPEGKALVKYHDEVFGRESQKAADLVVLATPLVNHPDGMELAKMLRVPLGPEKFFFEAHVKLRPVDFATDGIFLAGTAQFPKDIEESVTQALGASARAMTLLRSPKVMSEPIVSYIDPEKCTGCGTCLRVCAYSAISRGADRKAVITASLCKGCGTCVASCPENAIDEYGFSRFQLWSQAMALLGTGGEA